jgi:hypothetical protein
MPFRDIFDEPRLSLRDDVDPRIKLAATLLAADAPPDVPSLVDEQKLRDALKVLSGAVDRLILLCRVAAFVKKVSPDA